MQAFNQIWGFGLAVVACGLLSGELKLLVPLEKISFQSIGMVSLLVLLCIPIIPLISWNADSFRLPASLQVIEQLLEKAEADAENLLKSLTVGEGRVPKGLQMLESLLACPPFVKSCFFVELFSFISAKSLGGYSGHLAYRIAF